MVWFWAATAVFFFFLWITTKTKFKDKEEHRKKENEEYRKKLDEEHRKKLFDLKNAEQHLRDAEQDFIKKKDFFSVFLKEQQQSYPWLANQIADANFMTDKAIADRLRRKSHPALKASLEVSRIAKEKRDLQKLCKMYEYQLSYYENVFPWLEEFKELDPRAAWDIVRDVSEENYDSVRNWLSPEEYQKLATPEKLQLALDRYMKKKKNNWEIGRDFERYIGYFYETQKGYKVIYQGALLGKEDMGRDLIATKGNTTLIIQCKRWAREKTIHEKHIFQLYGSTVLFKLNNPNVQNVQGVFITTCPLSPLARDCADFLNIHYKQNYPISDYPIIKCNINFSTGEKIYHLPFDQQYDKVRIRPEKGEFYANTVAQAEAAGYRHAHKWRQE